MALPEHRRSTPSPCSRTSRRRPKAAASLEKATKLPHVRDGKCFAHVYPKAGEAVVIGATARRVDVDRSRKLDGCLDPERTKAEAVRRARTTVRRYCTEHGLRYMWTLTYRGSGEHDLARVRRHIEKLIAAVVGARGERFPYLWVPELHKTDHGIHVHMAVPFYFDQARLAKLWGRGHVWCSLMGRKGSCGFAQASAAARYVSKYVGKAFEIAEFGRHRYERAQGFPITSYRVRRYDMADGREYAEHVFRCAPSFVWSSTDEEDWSGPPCFVLFFMGRAPDG